MSLLVHVFYLCVHLWEAAINGVWYRDCIRSERGDKVAGSCGGSIRGWTGVDAGA